MGINTYTNPKFGAFSKLPTDIVDHILSFLNVEGLNNLKRVNNSLKVFLSNDKFWKPHASVLSQKQMGYYIECKSLKMVSPYADGLRDYLTFKGNYFFCETPNHDIEIWDVKTKNCVATLKGHTGKNTSCLQISKDRFASAADDHTLKIWGIKIDGESFELLCTVNDADTVVSMCEWDDHLYCGFKDGTIQILDLNNYKWVETLKGHAKSICFLEVKGGYLISKSIDRTRKIWDLKNMNCLHTFNSDFSVDYSESKLYHSGPEKGKFQIWDLKTTMQSPQFLTASDTDSIRGFAIEKGYLVARLASDSMDVTFKAWNLNTLECSPPLMKFIGNGFYIVKGDRIFVGMPEGPIHILKVKTMECLATLEGHTGSITSLLVCGDRLISGAGDLQVPGFSNDKTIRIWDLNTNKCLATLKGHTNSVKYLRVEENRLVSKSSGPDGRNTIKIWDFSDPSAIETGFLRNAAKLFWNVLK